MAVSKIQLPNNSTQDIHDARNVVIGDGADNIVALTTAQYEALQTKDSSTVYVITDSATPITIVSLTTAQYEALTTKDSNTLYVITDAGSSGGGGGSGEANVIEAITFNGNSVPVANKTAAITVSIPSALSSLSDDSTHRLVTDTEKSTWNGKQDTISDLASIRSGASAGATALQSFTETDPTVPSWAKASSKPTYTASEVGALPASTSIPSKTSDLTNDSGFAKITISTSEPSSSTGSNGDIWIVV